MEDRLRELLESFELPVMRQGSLSPEEAYPDTFFTFWENEETEHSAYDNETAISEHDFDVNVYSKDPEKIYSLLSEARKLLKENGWIIARRGYDVASDEITHTGRGMNVVYLRKEG